MHDLDLSPDLAGSSWQPAFDIRRGCEPATPLIYASPHSGRVYPPDLMMASVLDTSAIRRSEDVLVNELISGACEVGVTLISARYGRAYIDVNRDAYELDQAMFDDELPPFARAQTPRVAAGLGTIARIVAAGQEIYGRKLNFAEARDRIEKVHQPYHAALAELLAAAKARFDAALLIDWHSMPSAACKPTRGRRTPDMVLGDLFGASCTPAFSNLVDRELRNLGYEVARNAPYAGGYTTEFYGAPRQQVQVLQIEINRGLYLDETRLEPNAGFEGLKADIATLSASLAKDWRRLV
ncbi:MAG: N-formylglutamate amidohydrolase [Caulobacteraceae bacterium]